MLKYQYNARYCHENCEEKFSVMVLIDRTKKLSNCLAVQWEIFFFAKVC